MTLSTIIAVTDVMADAQANLTRLTPIRIPRDVSLVKRAAEEALDFLDTYGYNLVSDGAFVGLMSGHYTEMMAGIRAVNDAIQRHNEWTVQENRRRQEDAKMLQSQEAKRTAMRALGTLTGAARPAWLV